MHAFLTVFISTSIFLDISAQFGRVVEKRAVVIGISDYKDESIPDLEFGHIDAQVFASYLNGSQGGSYQSNKIALLYNNLATGGRVHNALNALLEESKPNDQIVIYFSGHGDIESNSDDEEGHLLLHDTPGNNYPVNSLRVTDLKRIIGV